MTSIILKGSKVKIFSRCYSGMQIDLTILYMLQFAVFLSTWKIVVETFNPILYVLYSPFYDAFLILRMNVMMI